MGFFYNDNMQHSYPPSPHQISYFQFLTLLYDSFENKFVCSFEFQDIGSVLESDLQNANPSQPTPPPLLKPPQIFFLSTTFSWNVTRKEIDKQRNAVQPNNRGRTQIDDQFLFSNCPPFVDTFPPLSTRGIKKYIYISMLL